MTTSTANAAHFALSGKGAAARRTALFLLGKTHRNWRRIKNLTQDRCDAPQDCLLTAPRLLLYAFTVIQEASHISEEEWAWVHGMIRDIDRDETREEFLRNLFQWDMAVRQFRKTELKRIIIGNPSQHDLDFHAMCLHALLAIGRSLLVESRAFEQSELKKNNISHDHIESYVEELEQSFREWHHGLTDEEVKAAETKIFGAAA